MELPRLAAVPICRPPAIENARRCADSSRAGSRRRQLWPGRRTPPPRSDIDLLYSMGQTSHAPISARSASSPLGPRAAMRMNGPNRGDSRRADVAANANIAAVAGRTLWSSTGSLWVLDRELFGASTGNFFGASTRELFCPSLRASVSTPSLEAREAERAAADGAAPPFACNFGQWIIDCFRLKGMTVSRHGDRAFREGSGRFDTRLDTPPGFSHSAGRRNRSPEWGAEGCSGWRTEWQCGYCLTRCDALGTRVPGECPEWQRELTVNQPNSSINSTSVLPDRENLPRYESTS
jgi:hypothetical protein